MLPDPIGSQMEGCPESNTVLYLILTSLLVPFLFVLYKVAAVCYKKGHKTKQETARRESMTSMAFAELQLELFGEKALKNLKHIGSSHDLQKLASLRSLDSTSKNSISKVETSGDSTSEDGSKDQFNDFMSFAIASTSSSYSISSLDMHQHQDALLHYQSSALQYILF